MIRYVQKIDRVGRPAGCGANGEVTRVLHRDDALALHGLREENAELRAQLAEANRLLGIYRPVAERNEAVTLIPAASSVTGGRNANAERQRRYRERKRAAKKGSAPNAE